MKNGLASELTSTPGILFVTFNENLHAEKHSE